MPPQGHRKGREYYNNVTKPRREEDRKNRELVPELQAEVLYLRAMVEDLTRDLDEHKRERSVLISHILSE